MVGCACVGGPGLWGQGARSSDRHAHLCVNGGGAGRVGMLGRGVCTQGVCTQGLSGGGARRVGMLGRGG